MPPKNHTKQTPPKADDFHQFLTEHVNQSTEALMTPRDRTATPTTETYEALQAAYDFFDEELFGGELKSCLITLQRRSKRTLGYFSPRRFAEIKGSAYTDEIALNPQWFTHSTPQQILSILVHEQCHLWQHHYGRPSRHRYHNRQWGAKMKQVGLYPSKTGTFGGKETGQQMMHYVISGGAFDKASEKLLNTNFALKWGEVVKAFGFERGLGREDANDENRSNRVKYSCPCCEVAVWGKPKLNIICGECRARMMSEE